MTKEEVKAARVLFDLTNVKIPQQIDPVFAITILIRYNQ